MKTQDGIRNDSHFSPFDIRNDSPLDISIWQNGDQIVILFYRTYAIARYIFEYVDGDFYSKDDPTLRLSNILAKRVPIVGWRKLEE